MGHAVPILPITYGANCTVGSISTPKLWDVGKTPKYVYASFSGLTMCDKPNCIIVGPPKNGITFKLTQKPTDACVWELNTGTYFLRWSITKVLEFGSSLIYIHDADRGWFDGSSRHATECKLWLENTNDCTGFRTCAEGGFGAICWNPGPAMLLDTYGFNPIADNKFDFWPIEDEQIVIRTFNYEGAMNVKFKLDW